MQYQFRIMDMAAGPMRLTWEKANADAQVSGLAGHPEAEIRGFPHVKQHHKSLVQQDNKSEGPRCSDRGCREPLSIEVVGDATEQVLQPVSTSGSA